MGKGRTVYNSIQLFITIIIIIIIIIILFFFSQGLADNAVVAKVSISFYVIF